MPNEQARVPALEEPFRKIQPACENGERHLSLVSRSCGFSLDNTPGAGVSGYGRDLLSKRFH